MKNVLILLGALGATFATSALAADEAQIQAGKQIYEYWCWNCHGEGVGKPGTVALDTKYKGAKPAILDQRTDLTPQITKYFVRHGVSIMPFFRKTEITDKQLEALAAYLARNSSNAGK